MLSSEFLTPDECYQVDTALLSAKQKFSARVAIYALRCLKQVAQINDLSIETVTAEQVTAWIIQDQTVQAQIKLDEGFERFFTQLVMASLSPLKQVSASASVSLSELTVQQVIHWFEQQAKAELGDS